MSTLALKEARMEQKTTTEIKDFLNKAAAVNGMDLSSFLISAGMKEARAIMRDHTTINLSAEGQAKLIKLIQSQPAPTEAMKQLRRLPRLKVRE